ncbi:MAG: ABC transporter permease [Thermaerobacter sp.]|nr:ABC transporter permease [Thermaerobacter sp.]
MTWADSLRTAWAGMWSSKLRALLTMLGVIIGVAAVITLVAIGNGASQAVASRIETLGTNVLFVTPGPGTPFTTRQVAYIRDNTPVARVVVPLLNSGGQLSVGTSTLPAPVVGTTPGYQALGAIHLAAGRFLAPADITFNRDAVVLGANVSQALFGAGNPVGAHVSLLGQRFTVVGVLQPVGQGPGVSQDNSVFIPLPVAQFLLSTQNLSAVLVGASSPTAASQAQDLLTNLYTNRFGSASSVTVASEDQVLATLSATRATFTNLLAGTALISLVVGGIGIMNIMLVSVTERTREIGVRRAVGAVPEDVVLQFLLEAMVMSLTGGALGVGVGLVLVHLAPLILKTPAVFTPSAVVLAFVFSTLVGLVFGMYPAVKASHLHPIDALRHSG